MVALAAGIKKSIGEPYEPLAGWAAIGLAGGVALFIVCEVGFRRTFGISRNNIRLVAAAAVLATIPIGTELGAAAQIGGVAAIVTAALVADERVTKALRVRSSRTYLGDATRTI